MPVALLVIALSATTIARNREYRSTLLLAQTVAERYPSDAARYMLGMELNRAGLFDAAVSELREAAPRDIRAYYRLSFDVAQPLYQGVLHSRLASLYKRRTSPNARLN